MIQSEFLVFRPTRDNASILKVSTTGLSPPTVHLSSDSSTRQIPYRAPTTPVVKTTGLGSSRFARRY